PLLALSRGGGFLLIVLLLCGPGMAQTWLAASDRALEADERQIDAALCKRGSVEFVETPLDEALGSLSRQFHVTIVLNRKKLELAGVWANTRVTRQLSDLPLESILRLLLADEELAFMVADGAVIVSSADDI